MHRLTARFLLLFAVAGTFAPLALAAAAATPQACCLRMAAHQCHGSTASESGQRTVHDASCCNHDWRRAVTKSQWASPQPRTASVIAQNIEAHVAEARTGTPPSELFASQSTRAPPPVSIA